LTSEKFFDLLQGITDKRVVAADVVEVTPPYDNGNTAALAARIIFELICNMEKTRKP
jgi:agmatinase